MSFSGWKIEGGLPVGIKKMIIIVAPHSTNWDFFVGLMVRGSMGFRANFLGKDALFKFPFGWIFRALGGVPVNRRINQNMVSQVVEQVSTMDSFILALAPEGTRSKVTKWRTGFYFIALEAGIPIVMCQLDWQHKTVRFLKELYYPTGNIEKDLPEIQSYFVEIKGYSDLK